MSRIPDFPPPGNTKVISYSNIVESREVMEINLQMLAERLQLWNKTTRLSVFEQTDKRSGNLTIRIYVETH
jgi:hypothetical protein